MQALLNVVLPVFLLIGFGYLVCWRGLLSSSAIDGVMTFAQNVAIPCLLFRAIWTLDLDENFTAPLLISFYSGSLTCFVTGLFGARYIFKRGWEDSVAIGFCCLFANSVLLGLAITERAYGADALAANYAIIALHSPFCYGLGITVMEFVRARATGQPNRDLPLTVIKASSSS
jgi:Predicted permeases